MVPEGVGPSMISSLRISSWAVGAESDAVRKFRLGNWRVHFDQHLIVTADVVITHILQQFLWLFCLAICARTRRNAEFRGYIWERMQNTLLRPLHQPCTDSLIFIIRIDAPQYPGVDRWLAIGPGLNVACQLSVRREDHAGILFNVEPR